MSAVSEHGGGTRRARSTAAEGSVASGGAARGGSGRGGSVNGVGGGVRVRGVGSAVGGGSGGGSASGVDVGAGSSGVGGGSAVGVRGGAADRLFGEGPLARLTAPIYTFLITDLLLLLATLPALVPLVALDRDASNAPLAVACALPVGPALSAAFYALRRRGRDFTDLHPAATFWRGYRMNFGGVLRVWVPWLAGMALIAESLSHTEAASVPGWWRVVLVVVAVVATLWMLNALMITSLFAFRPIDVARLAAYFLGRTRLVTVGNLGVLIAAALVVVTSSEAVLALVAVLFAALLLRTCAPMIDQVERDFTA